MELDEIRQRIQSVIVRRFGRAEEELLRSGLVDSLAAIELAAELEREFGLDTDSFALADMVSVTALSRRIQGLASP